MNTELGSSNNHVPSPGSYVDPTISTPRDSAARKFYLAYLNSGSWRTTRNRALRRAEYRCERCGDKGGLEVHHRTYERLGREWDQDLEVLCDECHGTHHEIATAQAGTNPRIYLKLVGTVIRGKAVQTFADLSEAVKSECAKLRIPYDSERTGHAIALVTGKQKPTAPVKAFPPAILTSSLPLNKADACAIFADLTKDDRVSVLRPMPAAAQSPEARHAHHLKVLEQSRDVQRAMYRRERRREPMVDRLERIFSERPA